MNLCETLQAFLDELKWEDEVLEHEGESLVDTGILVGSQRCRLRFVTDEATRLIRITMQSPISIPDDRRVVGAVVLNALNLRLGVGALHMSDDGTIYYTWAIDVEGTVASTAQFHSMLSAGNAALDRIRTAAIGAAAYSQLPTRRILAEYASAVEEAIASEKVGQADGG